MPSPTAFFGTLVLSAMLMAHGTARADEDAGMAVQGPLVQAEANDAPRSDSATNYARARQNIPTEIELVTGDGQQGSASSRSAGCADRGAECTQPGRRYFKSQPDTRVR